jgi:hypothetical protein
MIGLMTDSLFVPGPLPSIKPPMPAAIDHMRRELLRHNMIEDFVRVVALATAWSVPIQVGFVPASVRGTFRPRQEAQGWFRGPLGSFIHWESRSIVWCPTLGSRHLEDDVLRDAVYWPAALSHEVSHVLIPKNPADCDEVRDLLAIDEAGSRHAEIFRSFDLWMERYDLPVMGPHDPRGTVPWSDASEDLRSLHLAYSAMVAEGYGILLESDNMSFHCPWRVTAMRRAQVQWMNRHFVSMIGSNLG